MGIHEITNKYWNDMEYTIEEFKDDKLGILAFDILYNLNLNPTDMDIHIVKTQINNFIQYGYLK